MNTLKNLLKSNIFNLILLLSLAACGFSFKQISTFSKNKMVEGDPQSLNGALQVQKTLRLIAKSISPSIVNIQITQKKPKRTSLPFGGGEDLNDFLKNFFGRDFGFGGQAPQSSPQDQQQGVAMGSGFIITKDGYILTNAHVVMSADKIKVQTSDKRSFEAQVIGLDKKTDIALIKISSKKPFPVAPLGNSDSIEAGDLAIALGNPFGLNRTMSFGIISAKGRNDYIEENAPYKNYIQTDVSVNPGNSGGPLINIKGQVVGINSAIYSTSGGSIGISFAVPINIAKNIVHQLAKTGKITRGSIGVLINPVDEDIAKYNHLKDLSGVVINDVIKGGSAEKSGIKPGDIAIKLNNKKILNAGDFVSKISATPPSSTVKIQIMRNKHLLTIPLKIGSQTNKKNISKNSSSNKASAKSGTLKWKGLEFTTASLARKNGYNIQGSGIILLNVDENSKAAAKGLSPGMKLVSVENYPVSSLSVLKKILSRKKSLLFQFKIPNQSGNIFIVLP